MSAARNPYQNTKIEPDKSKAQASETPDSDATNKPEGGGYGGYIFAAIVGTLFAFFYQRKCENKEREAIIEAIDDSRVLVPSEIRALRKENRLESKDFEEIGLAAFSAFPSGYATPEAFFQLVFSDTERRNRCFPTLVSRGNIANGHLLERQITHCLLKRQIGMESADSTSSVAEELPIFELVAMLSLVIRGDPVRRAESLYRICSSEGLPIPQQRLEALTEALLTTFQFPPDSLITVEPARIKWVTPKHYHLSTATEMVEGAAAAHDHSAEEVSDLERFTALMLEKPMCLWGYCNSKAGRKKRQEALKNKGSGHVEVPEAQQKAEDGYSVTSKLEDGSKNEAKCPMPGFVTGKSE